MAVKSSWFASELRRELGLRNRRWARGHAHVESYGNPPVIVYPSESGRHGNFFDAAYAAIAARPEWMRRFDKIHAQGRALPKPESGRKWRELDSSMSSDALLMNVFCTPGVAEAPAVRQALGVDGDDPPVFGWKARVPLDGGRFDRTEVDMRWGGLLVEAKLTESDFQIKAAVVVEAYRDFDEVFDRELLPRVELATTRQREATEFPENYSQELEVVMPDAGESASAERFVVPVSARPSATAGKASSATDGESAYLGYQLIRNVLAAHAQGCSFCVIHDERRPDLREAWFEVMAAVKSAEMRVRLKVLTWQELAALLPEELQEFLDRKYGIVAPGRAATPAGDAVELE
ncbi:MAG TPA: hypothetical protein VKF63_11910 [Terracidiphilus sp.]|nr:hypothetical protein [Terracidiphilus sp.]